MNYTKYPQLYPIVKRCIYPKIADRIYIYPLSGEGN